MTQHRDRRRLLSPVLTDKPLVGEHLTGRLRIFLVALFVAFVLTNVTSYFMGQTFSADARANANRDTAGRVAELERKFNADLAERKAERDEENAAQAAKVEQLRRDICVVLDRVQPRDDSVQAARRRYGCVGGPSSSPTVAGSSSRGPGDATDGSPVLPPTAGPRGSAGQPGSPAPSPTGPRPSPSPSPSHTGRVCLPVLGCVL